MKSKFAFCILFCLACSLTTYGQYGALDNSFDIDGRNKSDFGNDDDYGSAVAIQSDNKLVVAGYTIISAISNFAVLRYNSDGSLDNTFDTDGKLTTSVGGFNDNATSVAIQTDGKIIVAGNTHDGSYWDFALVRYNTDGSLDNTFGTNGIVTTDIGGYNDYLNSIAIQSDGKIVATGSSNNMTYDDITVVRYNVDGSLDITFNGDGKVTTDFIGYNDKAYTVMLQSDDKILVAGRTSSFSSIDFALVRYESDGSLDNTFGTGGMVTTDFVGGDDLALAATLDVDGKIVVVGGVRNPSWDFGLARYNSDGSLDNTFSTDGLVITDFGIGDDMAQSVFIQWNGNVVATGYAKVGTYNDFAVFRYHYNGTLDNTFGTGGKVTTDFGLNNDHAYASLMQPDHKIVAVGGTYSGLSTKVDVAISRYENSILTDLTTNTISNKISIYPNPANNIVVMEVKEFTDNLAYALTDPTGKQVMTGSLPSKNTQIDISQLAAGVYTLQVGEQKVKLLKN
ncbi:MAG: T9SS type A sorting domain-containing protein [Flavobacteriales bacterium]|nr:T9SS type A sorting domain-containing protein [Flavobacteriales bacterium]